MGRVGNLTIENNATNFKIFTMRDRRIKNYVRLA
jgi:hypothetical protein